MVEFVKVAPTRKCPRAWPENEHPVRALILTLPALLVIFFLRCDEMFGLVCRENGVL